MSELKNSTELTENDIIDCPVNPCKHNATCVDTPERYFCKCLPGTSGSLCEIDEVDECANNPCGNRGTCIDKLYDYECQCTLGYAGRNCRENIDDCVTGAASSTCPASSSHCP